MRKIISIFILAALLSSCSWMHVRKMDVEQGNIITLETVRSLHKGMSEAEVKNRMGTPVLINTFSENRVDYVYTFKTGSQPATEKYVTLIFNKKGVLQEIRGNMYSQFIK